MLRGYGYVLTTKEYAGIIFIRAYGRNMKTLCMTQMLFLMPQMFSKTSRVSSGLEPVAGVCCTIFHNPIPLNSLYLSRNTLPGNLINNIIQYGRLWQTRMMMTC